MSKVIAYLCLSIVTATLVACGGSLPTSKDKIESPWDSFNDAKMAYDNVSAGRTTLNQLKSLGFDPYETPNVSILTYLDITRHFMPNQSLRPEQLPDSVRHCLTLRERCHGYLAKPEYIYKERKGSFFLDLFGFRREVEETGWRFKALIVIQDNLVVYKLWSGTPNVREHKVEKKPLGPLQDSSDLLKDAVL